VTDEAKPANEEPRLGLRAAYEDAAATVETDPDADSAFRLATELRAEADEIVSDAATLRARMALRLLESERLSLSQLAERLGTSKARADQLIRAARSGSGAAAPT
jgi:plasmid maintenance system antidote protein VapI